MKKLFLFILIILFISSVYKDLYFGTEVSDPNYTIKSEKESTTTLYDAIKVKISPGDTLLSIVERLNPERNTLDVDQVIDDFTVLNPTSDPDKLRVNDFYYFPQYVPSK